MIKQATYLMKVGGELYGYWKPGLLLMDYTESNACKVYKINPVMRVRYEEIKIEQIREEYENEIRLH